MGLTEKIKQIEEEMARTQKNKATEYHLGLLKAKLAKYRSQLIEGDKKAAAGGKGMATQSASFACLPSPRHIMLSACLAAGG